MDIGTNIALFRKKVGLTQEQLAEKCDVSRQAVTKWEAGISEPSIEKLVTLAEVFQVTIDELIREDKADMHRKIRVDIQELRFVDIAMCIACYRSCFDSHSTNYLLLEADILSNLILLYSFIGNKYISPEGNVYEKYLIKNTTKEERKKYVSLINRYESIDNYVNGKYEIDKALDMVTDEIDKDVSQIFNVEIKKKEESEEGKLYNLIKEIMTQMKILCVLNDKLKGDREDKLRQSIEQFRLDVEKYGNDTALGRFWSFLEQEVNMVYNSDDLNKVDELQKMVNNLRNFVWTFIPVEEEQNRRKKYDEIIERRYNQ